MTDDWSHRTGVEYQVQEVRIGPSQNISVITISESAYSLLRILTSPTEKRFLTCRYRRFDGRKWADNRRSLIVQVVGADCPVIAAYLQAEEKEVFGTERIRVAPDSQSLRHGRICFPLNIAKLRDFNNEADSVDGWSYRLFKLNVFYPSLLNDATQRFQEYFDDAWTFGRSLTILRPEGADSSLLKAPLPPPQLERFGGREIQPVLEPTPKRDFVTPDPQSLLHAGRPGGASVMQLVGERTSGASSVTRLQGDNRASGRSSTILESGRPNAPLAYIDSDARPGRLESVVQLGGSDLPPQRLGSTITYGNSEEDVRRTGSSFQSSSTIDLPSRLGSSIQHALPDDVPYRLGSASYYSSYSDQPSRLGTSFQYTLQDDIPQRLGTAGAEYNTPYAGLDPDDGNNPLHVTIRQGTSGERFSPIPDPIQRSRTPVNSPLRPPTRPPSPPSPNEARERFPWNHPLRTCNNNSITAQYALQEAVQAVSCRQRENYHTRFKAEYDAQYDFLSRAASPLLGAGNEKHEYDPRPVIADVLIMNLADVITSYPSQSKPHILDKKRTLLQVYLERVWERLVDLPSILSSEGTAYVVLPAVSMTTAIMMALKARIARWSDHAVHTVWNVVTVGVTRGGEEVLCIWRDDAELPSAKNTITATKGAGKVAVSEVMSEKDDLDGTESGYED
jgi:hypothetical protein